MPPDLIGAWTPIRNGIRFSGRFPRHRGAPSPSRPSRFRALYVGSGGFGSENNFLCAAQSSYLYGIILLMGNYPYGGEDERRILQCVSCDATVVAEASDAQQRDGDTVCALCGMTMTDSAPEGADYFDVVMKAGRGIARLRRTG